MYWLKAFLATLTSAAGAFVVALGTGTGSFASIDTKHWLIAGLTILGSGGIVAACENIVGIAGGVAKMIVAFLSTGIASLVIALNDHHITQAEWLTAFTAAVTATGLVYQATNGVRLTGARARA